MTTSTAAGVEPAYGYRELEDLGEGSRWRIDRAVREGRYPAPDYYEGRFPRWLASTIQRHRETLIAQHNDQAA